LLLLCCPLLQFFLVLGQPPLHLCLQIKQPINQLIRNIDGKTTEKKGTDQKKKKDGTL